MEADTPQPILYDADGNAVRGRYAPAFLNWCADNHMEMNGELALEMWYRPLDVRALANARDPRSISIFQRGLESPNVQIVGASVLGLGMLNDLGSLPAIAQAAEEIPMSVRSIVAANLSWFTHPDALRLMEKLEPNQAVRSRAILEVQPGSKRSGLELHIGQVRLSPRSSRAFRHA